MPSIYTTPTHNNRNPLAAIWMDCTGPEAEYHQIVRLCILPIDANFRINKTFLPFYVEMKPDNPMLKINIETCDVQKDVMCDVGANGYTQEQGRQIFTRWFDGLDLPFNKWACKQRSLIPLGYDYPRVQVFLRAWLGPEAYEVFFLNQYRDVKAISGFMNDMAWFRGRADVPYSKHDFTWLCTVTGNTFEGGRKNPVYMADKVAAVYRTLLGRDYLST